MVEPRTTAAGKDLVATLATTTTFNSSPTNASQQQDLAGAFHIDPEGDEFCRNNEYLQGV
jgi:hypothetical protein